MEVVYRLGQASVSEVLEHIPDPPSYSATRALLRILENKGVLRHKENGRRYLYMPVVPRERARRSALHGVLQNFFGGSRASLIAELVNDADSDLTRQEANLLKQLILRAKKEGR
jgi:predicted transcriptional regulator